MPDRPNILFLHSDEHSYRFLSSRPADRGGEPCRTPTLDRLAAQGVFFENAYSQMPLCTPSRISMLTGRHSHLCAAWTNMSILDPELPTFGSHLSEAGYATAAVGKMHIGGSAQFAGFDHRPYGDFGGPCAHQPDPLRPPSVPKDAPGSSLRNRTLDADISDIPEGLLQENVVVRESTSWIREHRHANPDTPWLLYATFSRPHFPLTAPRRFFDRYYPEGVNAPHVGPTGDSADHPMTQGAIEGFRTNEIGEEEGRKARAAYFAAVDFLDEILGDFLTILERDGSLDNTVIVYTSDHGEMCGEHGLWWKNTWHEASAHVPLIISTPGHRRGEREASHVTQAVSLADCFPTLCGLAGVEPPGAMDGIDLSEAIRGGACDELDSRQGVITESLSNRWGEGTEFRMLTSSRYKYIAFRDCDDLAFDLQNDPDEQVNLLKNPDAETAAALEAMRAAIYDGFDFDSAIEEMARKDSELKERYPKKVEPKTPNQIWLGNGKLVEADAPLYDAIVLSEDANADFDR